MIIYVVLGIILIALIYALTTYNALVRLRNAVREAFSTMDVYLKRRWDLIPNLIEVVKGYTAHESGVLESVVSLRNLAYDKMSQNEQIDTNAKLSSGLARLIAISENYPDLKANQAFSDLRAELSKTEDDIANSRKYYNAVVRNMNTATEVFPSSIIASLFGFQQYNMYEAEAGERDSVKVSFS